MALLPARAPARAGDLGPQRFGLGLASLGRPGYLNLGHADIVLSGVATRSALAGNLAAVELRLPDGAFGDLAALEEDHEGYWSARAELPWT